MTESEGGDGLIWNPGDATKWTADRPCRSFDVLHLCMMSHANLNFTAGCVLKKHASRATHIWFHSCMVVEFYYGQVLYKMTKCITIYIQPPVLRRGQPTRDTPVR